MAVVRSRYGRSQSDYERNAILAVSSIYGIDIIYDNVTACRSRLFETFNGNYTSMFKKKTRDVCRLR